MTPGRARVEPEHDVPVLDPPRTRRSERDHRELASRRAPEAGRPAPLEQHEEVGGRRAPRGRRARAGTRISSATSRAPRSRVHRLHERADASRLLDRERLGGVVRGAEEEPVQQVADRDPLTGPEPERGAGTVVAAIEDGVRDRPDDVGRDAAFGFEDEERGHHFRQARDRPRPSGALGRGSARSRGPSAPPRRLDPGDGGSGRRGSRDGDGTGTATRSGDRRRRRRGRGAERPERRDLRRRTTAAAGRRPRHAAAVRLTRSAGGRAGSCGGEPA